MVSLLEGYSRPFIVSPLGFSCRKEIDASTQLRSFNRKPRTHSAPNYWFFSRIQKPTNNFCLYTTTVCSRVLKTVGFLCVHVIVHGAVVVCCKHPSPATKNTTKKGGRWNWNDDVENGNCVHWTSHKFIASCSVYACVAGWGIGQVAWQCWTFFSTRIKIWACTHIVML